MSEYIDNSSFRKSRLKELILKLHEGVDPGNVRRELEDSLRAVPYGEVVEVEQELIAEGLPQEEVLRLCDIHSGVLEGRIDLSAMRIIPPGHPVDVFRQENKELIKVADQVIELIGSMRSDTAALMDGPLLELRGHFNALLDVDKHYQRKEYLVFPYLEQKGITGPPQVMWGKHDEVRDLIKGAIEILGAGEISREELLTVADMVLLPAAVAVKEMTVKEEQILFPMCLDQITEGEWLHIHQQTMEIGYCLYDPPIDWKPVLSENQEPEEMVGGRVQLPTGSFSPEELVKVFNSLPVDITFVDKDDKVKYFSQAADRIFTRSRAIINRDVRHCHPPSSVHIVEKILDDFKSGRASYAPFWIQMKGKFIHIAYYALRDDKGEYMGTLEVSQDLTEYRALQGEQRILEYR
jgi:DUF438 domain-containing protein